MNIVPISRRTTVVLPGHGPARTLMALAKGLDGDEDLDNYREGAYLVAFEAEMAALFGKETTVFILSGTITQQTALPIWCDRRIRAERKG